MREDLKGRHLSFTEIAKLVGEHWQNLSPQEREPFELQASGVKEKYNNELAEYKKTEQYKEYSRYLIEFKTRQAKQQQQQQHAGDSDSAKRPKLEAHTSTNSNSSGTSQSTSEPWIGRRRVDSAATTGSWPPSTRQLSTPTHSPGVSKMNMSHAPAPSPSHQSNPGSPTVLPGYRDSHYGDAHPALPWREGQHDETSAALRRSQRAIDHPDLRTNYAGKPPSRSENPGVSGAAQNAHHSAHSRPPPSLTSESSTATRSSTSSASTSSSFFNPRTPLDTGGDRALPIPAMYPQKSYDNQLPPLRATQASMLGGQHSPHGMLSPRTVRLSGEVASSSAVHHTNMTTRNAVHSGFSNCNGSDARTCGKCGRQGRAILTLSKSSRRDPARPRQCVA